MVGSFQQNGRRVTHTPTLDWPPCGQLRSTLILANNDGEGVLGGGLQAVDLDMESTNPSGENERVASLAMVHKGA